MATPHGTNSYEVEAFKYKNQSHGTIYSAGGIVQSDGTVKVHDGHEWVLAPGGDTSGKNAKNTAKQAVGQVFDHLIEMGDPSNEGGEGDSHKGSSNSGAVVDNLLSGKIGHSPEDQPEMFLSEPMTEDDMKRVHELPMSPTVTPDGQPISKGVWRTMTPKQKLDALNATTQAQHNRKKVGLDPLPTTGTVTKKEMRRLMSCNGQGDALNAAQIETLNSLRDAKLVPEFSAGGVPVFEALDNWVGEQAKGNVFLPKEINPVLSGGAQPNNFKMNKDIADAMAYGGAVSFPSDVTSEAKEAMKVARREYKKLEAEGVVPRTINFNPPQKNRNVVAGGTTHSVPAGPSIQAIKKASTFHGTFELGPQKYSDENHSAKANDMYFDDLFSMMNIKDPASGFDLGSDRNGVATASGGPDLTRRQKVSAGQVLNNDLTFTKATNIKCHPREQPKGSLFVGKATSSGGKAGSCGIIAPPNVSIPAKYDDVPRLDLFKCGANTTDVGTSASANKNLVRRIMNDFKEADVDVGPTQIADDTGTWSSATLDSTHISPDMFKVRANDDSSGKVSLFKDSSSGDADIAGLPPIKQRAFTFGGKTRTYQVLDPVVKMDTRKFSKPIRSSKGRSMKFTSQGYSMNNQASGQSKYKQYTTSYTYAGGGSLGPYTKSPNHTAPRYTCSGFPSS